MKITRGIAIGVGVASLLLVLGGCVTTKSKRLADPHAQADAAADNVQLAMAYIQEGNLARAKEKLDRALKEDPGNANVHSVYAFFYEHINPITSGCGRGTVLRSHGAVATRCAGVP